MDTARHEKQNGTAYTHKGGEPWRASADHVRTSSGSGRGGPGQQLVNRRSVGEQEPWPQTLSPGVMVLAWHSPKSCLYEGVGKHFPSSGTLDSRSEDGSECSEKTKFSTCGFSFLEMGSHYVALVLEFTL